LKPGFFLRNKTRKPKYTQKTGFLLWNITTSCCYLSLAVWTIVESYAWTILLSPHVTMPCVPPYLSSVDILTYTCYNLYVVAPDLQYLVAILCSFKCTIVIPILRSCQCQCPYLIHSRSTLSAYIVNFCKTFNYWSVNVS